MNKSVIHSGAVGTELSFPIDVDSERNRYITYDQIAGAGSIKIQYTLQDNPLESDWIDLYINDTLQELTPTHNVLQLIAPVRQRIVLESSITNINLVAIND